MLEFDKTDDKTTTWNGGTPVIVIGISSPRLIKRKHDVKSISPRKELPGQNIGRKRLHCQKWLMSGNSPAQLKNEGFSRFKKWDVRIFSCTLNVGYRSWSIHGQKVLVEALENSTMRKYSTEACCISKFDNFLFTHCFIGIYQSFCCDMFMIWKYHYFFLREQYHNKKVTRKKFSEWLYFN